MRTKIAYLVAIVLAASVLFGACKPAVAAAGGGDTPPAVAGGTGSVGGTDSAKIAFESSPDLIGSGNIYNPGTGLTKVDGNTAFALSTDYFYAGTSSMKISGTAQEDQYGTTIELGARIKAAAIMGVTDIDMTNRVLTIHVYVPAAATNTKFQMVLGGGDDAISDAIPVTLGEWNTFYFKCDPSYLVGGKPALNQVDSNYAVLKQGVYTSAAFNIAQVKEFAIRSIGATIGEADTLYIDSLTWTDTAQVQKCVAPVYTNDPSVTYTASTTATATSSTASTTIHYTVANAAGPAGPTAPADPTSSDTTTAPTMTPPGSGTMIYIVKAIASASGLADSNVTTATYTLASAASSGALNFNSVSVGAYGSIFAPYSPGTAEVVAAPATAPETVTADGQTNLFHANLNTYNQGALIPINLPQALSNYTTINVRVWVAGSGDYSYKTFMLDLGTATQWTNTPDNIVADSYGNKCYQNIASTAALAGTGAINVGTSGNGSSHGEWITMSFTISADTQTVIGSSTALKLGFGANANGMDFFISSITFQ